MAHTMARRAASRVSSDALHSPSPAEAVVASIRTALLARADPATAAGASAYFKGVADFYGVRTPEVDAVVDGVGGRTLAPPLLHAAAGRLLADSVHEMKHAGVYALHRSAARASRHAGDAAALVDVVEAAFDAGHVYDWATCDGLSTRVLAPCMRPHAALARRVAGWHTSRGMWKQRASAVSFVKLAAAEYGYQPVMVDVATALAPHPERFVQLGVGWMLRELGVAAPAMLEAVLAVHAPAMSREGLRYALEKSPPALRAAMLALPSIRPGVPVAGGTPPLAPPLAAPTSTPGTQSGTKRRQRARSAHSSAAAPAPTAAPTGVAPAAAGAPALEFVRAPRQRRR